MARWKWLVAVLVVAALPLWVFVIRPWVVSIGKPVSRDDMADWPFMADGGHAGCESAVTGDAVWFRPDGDDTKYPMNTPALLEKPIDGIDYKYPGRPADILTGGTISAHAVNSFFSLACGYQSSWQADYVAEAVNANRRG